MLHSSIVSVRTCINKYYHESSGLYYWHIYFGRIIDDIERCFGIFIGHVLE